MYLLDTDHVSLLHRAGQEGEAIRQRLVGIDPFMIALCIISYEEQVRGWMAEIARARMIDRQQPLYAELMRMLQLYCASPVLPFDSRCVTVYQDLWLRRLRIGTMDLKIAAIALSNDATLLTRNSRDFNRIPELKLEDWSS